MQSFNAPRSLALAPAISPTPPQPTVNPPTNLTGYQNKDDFGLIYEWVNTLNWNASSSSVQGYHVYRNGMQIATLGSSTYQFSDHNIPNGISILYSVTAFDSLGTESSEVSITIQ